MTVFDLTHEISENILVLNGDLVPEIESSGTFRKEGYRMKSIRVQSHTGTHVDAPAHMLKKGKTLDEYSMDKFFGTAVCLDLCGFLRPNIEPDDLAFAEKLIRGKDFLLLNTGWQRFWGQGKYFSGFPCLSEAAARWLTGFSLKAVGLDAVSADAFDSRSYPVHHILLEKDILIVENLTNTLELPGRDFEFFCLPMKIREADGAPVRAMARF